MMRNSVLMKNSQKDEIWYENLGLSNPAKFKFTGSPEPKKSTSKRIVDEFGQKLAEQRRVSMNLFSGGGNSQVNLQGIRFENKSNGLKNTTSKFGAGTSRSTQDMKPGDFQLFPQ